MHVVCANIFGANVLKSRFKIDVDVDVESSVDEHNLYFERSAIIGYLAVET